MNATSSDPSCSAITAVDAHGTREPSQKQTTMNSRSASAFNRLVTFCTAPAERTPSHCTTVRIATTASATTCCVRAAGHNSTVYSPTTIATAAVVPHVEIQSLQPTTKPA